MPLRFATAVRLLGEFYTFAYLRDTLAACAFKIDWFTANTPGSVKGVASFRIASLRFRLCGCLYIPSGSPSSPSSLTHRCVHHQPLQLNNMKCSFCNLAFCCLAFVFHLSLLAPGRSAGTAGMTYSSYALMLPAPGSAVLQLSLC